MVDAALVKIWGELVGAVRWDAATGQGVFEYDPDFVAKGYDLAPLQMPIRSRRRLYRFPQLVARPGEVDTFKGMPGLLADSLPDKYGNRLIAAWLAKVGRPVNDMNPVETLCFIGTRGMGALEFEPAQEWGSSDAFAFEIEALVEYAARVLSERQQVRTNVDDQEAMKTILSVGTSAGGVRPKAVIAYNPETGEVRSGQSSAPAGFSHWLLKLDGVSGEQFGSSHGWGNVEYAYYQMAVDCEIDMMPSKLLKEGGRSHFLTRRFDRDGRATKHHVQTFCGLAHFDYSQLGGYAYEQLFQTMRQLRLPYAAADQLFRRMVFNVLATNCDDHTKNFGFRLRQGEEWELAPAYDVCYAYDERNVWVNSQTMSINGKRRDVNLNDFLAVAKEMSIKNAGAIVEQVREVVMRWRDYADLASVPDQLADMVQENLRAPSIVGVRNTG